MISRWVLSVLSVTCAAAQLENPQPLAWEARPRATRTGALAAMQEIMGPLAPPAKFPLEVEIQQERDCGSFITRFLTYATEPGSRVPALLLLPKKALQGDVEPGPAILCLHATNFEHGPKTLIDPRGHSYPLYGKELAELGYIVLAPSYPTMNGYRPDFKALGYLSGSMKAVVDNQRALDLLGSLPAVNPRRIAAVGHSLGGHNALFTAAFDTRIQAVVTSCGFDSFRDYQGGNLAGWTSERYMPRLSQFATKLDALPFDFDDVLSAIAPHRIFVSAPVHDTNFSAASVDKIVARARPAFSPVADAALHVVHPEAAHDFPPATRLMAWAFLEKALALETAR